MKKAPPPIIPPGGPALPPVSVEIIRWLRKYESMNIRSFRREMYASRRTLGLHLRKLVDLGLVKRHGRGKATWYTL